MHSRRKLYPVKLCKFVEGEVCVVHTIRVLCMHWRARKAPQVWWQRVAPQIWITGNLSGSTTSGQGDKILG